LESRPCLDLRSSTEPADHSHAHHDVEIDQPGRDSFRHRAAGAVEVALVGGRRYAIMREQDEPTLAEVLARLPPADLILIEGYEREPHPKIEVCGAPGPSLAADESSIVAIAADIAQWRRRRPFEALEDPVSCPCSRFWHDLLTVLTANYPTVRPSSPGSRVSHAAAERLVLW
jgi:molybdopterin-guanine dinucleotide biosynthesis protein MobB